MESWKPKIQTYNHKSMKSYGRTTANAPCRKHPKHVQSPGVCSLCLNQRLSILTSTSASSRVKRAANSLSSSSSSSSYISSLSSSDASSYSSSPVLNFMGQRKSTRAFKNLDRETLNKSRSMAFLFQRRKGEDGNVNKRGFWSKFLSRKSKALMYPRTTIVRVQ